MNIVITGGGSGGHIYPALAIVEGLKRKYSDLKIVYIGTTNRMEKDIVPEHVDEYIGIEMQGLNRKNIFKNFKLIYLLIRNYLFLRKYYKNNNVDIVIGTGGYVTVPVVFTAAKSKIPTLIFDADVSFGVATSKLIKYVDVVCSGYESNCDYNDKVLYTGNPRAQLVYEHVERSNNADKVLMLFGSLGSETMNKFFKDYFNEKELDYQVKYVTGKRYYEDFINGFNNSNVEVVSYIDNVEEVLRDVKYVVCRSGAGFISELVALKIPAIYIPSPYVSNNEQLHNVKNLLSKKCSLMIEEKNLSVEKFNCLTDEMNESYNLFVNNLSTLQKVDCLDVIVNEIEKLIGDESE